MEHIDREKNIDKQQSQDRRSNEMQQDGGRQWVQPQKPQASQQCPHCESLDTRFCYYNNYKSTQPRYFCKKCKRYWTQGGTLRNVPITRRIFKGKRTKSPSTSQLHQPLSSSSLQEVVVQTQHLQPQETVVRTQLPNFKTFMMVRNLSHMVAPPTSHFYQGGHENLSSIGTIHSMTPSQPSTFDQSLGVGVSVDGSSSNLGHAFDFTSNSLVCQGGNEYLSSMEATHAIRPSQPHTFDQSHGIGVGVVDSSSKLGHAFDFTSNFLISQHPFQPTQFYQMGNKESDVNSLDTPQDLFIPSSIAHHNINDASHNDCPQNFINNSTPDALFSSTINNSTTSISGNNERNNPYTPSQWYEFSGYDTLP
ncbi:hypothetical protein TanjilG_20611 [Lupinus angustifolius]|uniref:Dof-type domain-containing protein n=1 Tax=Lupinus angustifolius TaxID=3871 RepID=A0A4P1QRA5_LUPAN|nr:PREDICTED: dof zinc finger protein DOF1.4-like [Lupinus angustifolius]OIV92949.1 hypothetical protein TanjilG_20611 [Lupinus angustifolius]